MGRSGKMLQFNWTTEEALKSDLCLPSVTVQVDLTEAGSLQTCCWRAPLQPARHKVDTLCLVSTSFLIIVAIRHLKHKP